jgi:chromate transport protein ChrA
VQIGQTGSVLLVTLVVVGFVLADVLRRPRSTWTSDRERAIWIALLLAVAAVTLLSFSLLGPLLTLAVVIAYGVSRSSRGEPRRPTATSP